MSGRSSFSRGLAALTTLALLIVAVFLTLAVVPGDQLAAALSEDSGGTLTVERRAALVASYGLDRPWPQRLATWAGKLLRGDLGRSWRTGRAVGDELLARLAPTLELNLAALSLLLLFGLPLGWFAAAREGRAVDFAIGSVTLALYAIPLFWLALALQQWWAVSWRVLPLFGREPPTAGLLAWAAHVVLPASCLAAHGLSYLTGFVRGATLDGWGGAARRVGRAAGIPERRLFLRLAIQPSLFPLVTWFGMVIPGLITGSVAIEWVFGWPGLGQYYVECLLARDVPCVLAMTLFGGASTLAGSLLAETAIGVLDRRAVHSHHLLRR